MRNCAHSGTWPRSEERRVGKECRCRGWPCFSSRRRHTRWNCDWSSDVCSSDLLLQEPVAARYALDARVPLLEDDGRVALLDRGLRLTAEAREDAEVVVLPGDEELRPLRDVAEIGRASCRERV